MEKGFDDVSWEGELSWVGAPSYLRPASLWWGLFFFIIIIFFCVVVLFIYSFIRSFVRSFLRKARAGLGFVLAKKLNKKINTIGLLCLTKKKTKNKKKAAVSPKNNQVPLT